MFTKFTTFLQNPTCSKNRQESVTASFFSYAQSSLGGRCNGGKHGEKGAGHISLDRHNSHKQLLFTNEKMFAEVRSHNRHNDRVLLRPDSIDSLVTSRSYFSASVMVFAWVCATEEFFSFLWRKQQKSTLSTTRNKLF